MYEPVPLNHYCKSNNYDMIKNENDILRNLILAECDIPERLFAAEDETEKNCYFLFENATKMRKVKFTKYQSAKMGEIMRPCKQFLIPIVNCSSFLFSVINNKSTYC